MFASGLFARFKREIVIIIIKYVVMNNVPHISNVNYAVSKNVVSSYKKSGMNVFSLATFLTTFWPLPSSMHRNFSKKGISRKRS